MSFIINLLYLPVLFFIGIITSYEDNKWGKIRNKWTFFGLSWGLGVLVLFFLWNLVAEPVSNFFYFNFLNKFLDLEFFIFQVDYSFIWQSFLNIFIAILVSFLMWKFNAWTAGDAKLFMTYSALIPISYYWKSYLPFFPAFALMVNIFVLVLFYLVFKSIIFGFISFYLQFKEERSLSKLIKKIKILNFFKKNIKNFSEAIYVISALLLILVVFSFLSKPFQGELPFDLFTLQAIVFAFVIIFSGYLFKFFKYRLVFRIVCLSLILISTYGLITDFYFALRTISQSAILVTLFMIFFMILHEIIELYIERVEKKIIKIKNLRPGMNLNEGELDRLGFEKNEGLKGGGGLTKEQVKAVKKQARRKKTNKVSIYKTFPFAFWMFLGVLLTLILKGSIVSLII